MSLKMQAEGLVSLEGVYLTPPLGLRVLTVSRTVQPKNHMHALRFLYLMLKNCPKHQAHFKGMQCKMKGSTEMNSWLIEGCHMSPMKVGLHNSSKGPTFKVRASKLDN